MAANSNGEQIPNLRLRQARLDQGWSQHELADRLGTTHVNISRWENGTIFPNRYFRQRLSEVFDRSLDALGLTHDPRIEQIPIARNPYFTGREHLLTLLHKRLSTTRETALIQAQTLYGLGGVGKTQTAAEYAYRYGYKYTHVFWLHAASRDALIADMLTLAELLNLPKKEEPEQPRIIEAVKRWMAEHDGWLLIMDNADDLRMAREFLPLNHKGYILYTTRAQASGAIAASIAVERLNTQDGTLLLLRWTKHLTGDASLDQVPDVDRAAAERVVETMDGLPLAIVQAAAYMEETGCTPADYLRIYETHHKDLLAHRSDLVLDYPDSVATTWSVSFKLVEQQNPAAADVLRLCAFLAANAIPEELLTRGTPALGELPGSVVSDPYHLDKALEVLRRYSLVRRDGSSHTLSIHPLVQTVLKDSLDQHTQRAWAERTVRVLSAAFPASDQDTGANRHAYIPHIQQCALLIEQYRLYFPEAGHLLFQAAAFLYYHGFHPQSESLHRQALAISEKSLGPEHLDVAESLNALGILARCNGDFEQAEEFHRHALSIREKALGPDHPTTLQSLNNLGVLYRNQGKYKLAEPLLQQALGIRERVLGPEHPNTLITFNNLSKLYIEQRKYEQAEQMLKSTLATGEQALKPGDPIIAQALNLLARLYFEQDYSEQAETLWKLSLAILEETLGRDHPATAERLTDLAELFFTQGRYPEAQSFCQKAIDICEKRLGSEHPDTIAYRDLLMKIESQ